MFTPKSRVIGDAWHFIAPDGKAHMFFLTQSLEDCERHGYILRAHVGHAVSSNLIDWEEAPPALEHGKPGSLDDLKLATGSVFAHAGRYYMSYTAYCRKDGLAAPRCLLASSSDLYEWTREPWEAVGLDASLYAGPDEKGSADWRDPFVVFDGGEFRMHVCAKAKSGAPGRRGAVAVAKSKDLKSWRSDAALVHDAATDVMETPQVRKIGSRYYLLFCTQARWMDEEMKERMLPGGRYGADFCMVSESPGGPFRLRRPEPVIPPSIGLPYASQLEEFQGRLFLLGTEFWGTLKNRVSDPIPVIADENGLLAIQP